MVPVEQPQLGWGVAVHTAQEEPLTSNPISGSIGLQLGSERGQAWGICREGEHRRSSHGLHQVSPGPLKAG